MAFEKCWNFETEKRFNHDLWLLLTKNTYANMSVVNCYTISIKINSSIFYCVFVVVCF